MTENEFEIQSDLAQVKNMADHFKQFCVLNQLEETISIRLELALVEALNNIIIHAYDNNTKHVINAKFEIFDTDLSITLTDDGKEFEYRKAELKNQDSEEGEIAEGNWGLGIITSISDEVIRYRENNQNILKIIKRIT